MGIVMKPPAWARPFVLSEHEFDVDGQIYKFWVLKKELAIELRNFVGFPEGFLFISEEVPTEFRKFMLRHEVREVVNRAGQEGRCLATLRQELDEVPLDICVDYIRFRRELFRSLVMYYACQGGNEELKRELAGSLAYLETL